MAFIILEHFNWIAAFGEGDINEPAAISVQVCNRRTPFLRKKKKNDKLNGVGENSCRVKTPIYYNRAYLKAINSLLTLITKKEKNSRIKVL